MEAADQNTQPGFITFPEDVSEEAQTEFRANFEKYTGKTEVEMQDMVSQLGGTTELQTQFDQLSDSKISSIVPKPPGNAATASLSFTNASLRVKK